MTFPVSANEVSLDILCARQCSGSNPPKLPPCLRTLSKDCLQKSLAPAEVTIVKLAGKRGDQKECSVVSSAEVKSSPLKRLCKRVSIAVSSEIFQPPPTTHPDRIRASNTFDDGNSVNKMAIQLKNVPNSNSAANTCMYAAYDTSKAHPKAHKNDVKVFRPYKEEVAITQR